MSVSRVLTRGQITLPKHIRQAAGIRAGDLVSFTVAGPGSVQLRVLPRLKLAEALERYVIEGPIDEDRDRAAWQAAAADDVVG